MVKNLKPILKWMIIVLVFLFLVLAAGADFLVEAPILLVFGWFKFLGANIAAMEFNTKLFTEAVICLFFLSIGTHYFMAWLYAQSLPEAVLKWKVKWTFSFLAIILLLFSAGIGTIGFTHQLAWLISSDKPLILGDAYPVRIQVSEAVNLTSALTTPLAEYYADEGKWPTDFKAMGLNTSGKYVANAGIVQGAGGNGDIVVQAFFKSSDDVKPEIRSKTFSISSSDGGMTWQCGVRAISGTDIDARFLPGNCK